jgi:hypothetical protein
MLRGSILLLLLIVSSRLSFADDPKLNSPPQKEAPTAFAAQEPSPVKDWGVGEGKSYLVPAWEVPAFELLLNRVDHYAVDSQVYASPLSNFKDNLHHKWVVDNDAFATNL